MNVQIAVLFPSARKPAAFMLVACALNFICVKNQIAISTPSHRRLIAAHMAKAKASRVRVSDIAALFVCTVCLAIALMAFVAVLMP